MLTGAYPDNLHVVPLFRVRRSSDHHRILLIHPGALGDLVQALPAFSAVRGRYPTAHLTLSTAVQFADVVRPLSLFDALDTFDARVAYGDSVAARAALLVRLAATFRAQHFDTVGVFKAAPVYAALAAASGAPVRAGWTRGWGARLLTAPLPIDPQRHRADRYFDVARALGAAVEDATPVAWPHVDLPAAFAAAAQRARGERLVAVAPGGARNIKQENRSRRWAGASYGAALLAATRHDPLTAVLLGAASDRDDADTVIATLAGRVPVIDLIGQTTVAGARAVISACDAFLGNDSGLMHVAGTTTTPIVAVFGPSDPRAAAPRGPHVATLWRPARATPCLDEVTGRFAPCAAECCMSRVGPDEVARALTAALAGAREALCDPV